MKRFEKIIAVGMLIFAIGFNLWLYRLEPSATIDPNDNAFQFALVDRTNQVWDFASKKCSDNLLTYPICFSSYLVDHWVPNWAEGYNLPFYYSHVPQILIVGSWRMMMGLTSFMGQMSQMSLFQYYHFIIYLLLCFFPLSVFLALRVIKLPWLVAGIGAILASHLSTDGLYGLDPPSFLWRGYGLSSQLFGMVWMPMAIAYAWRFFATNPKHQSVNPKQDQNTNVQKPKLFQSFGFGIWNLFRIWHLEVRILPAVWPAVLFLAATDMSHLGLGIMAMHSLVPLAFARPLMMMLESQRISDIYEVTKNQLTKLFLLSAVVIFPELLDRYFPRGQLPQHLVLGPPWKFASWGSETITNFSMATC